MLHIHGDFTGGNIHVKDITGDTVILENELRDTQEDWFYWAFCVSGAQGRTLTFRMADKGIPFDPLKKPDPDITLSAEDRPMGGLGIYMVKKSMDDVTYAYRDGQNVLTIKKNLY